MKVYEYGAEAPRTNAEVVSDQMHAAHRYYNTLVEIERRRRAEYDALMSQHDEYQALADLAATFEEEIDALRAQIKAIRKCAAASVETNGMSKAAICAARKLAGGGVNTVALNAKVHELRESMGFARALARAAKIEARERLAVPLEALNAEDLKRRKAARAACGVYWGSYLVVEDAMEQARKSPAPPRFKRWTGDGHLSVQIIHGMTVTEACSCDDTRFQLRAPPEDAWISRARRRRAQCTLCRIRVGSTESREPIWTEVPLYMHRPLPADATIKRVHLLRQRMADRERWKVQLTVDTAEVKAASVGHGAIGVDIGWRVVPEGLRVAYWRDGEGKGGQLALDHDLFSALTKAESLRSIRDRNLDEMKAAVVPAIKTLLAGTTGETEALHALREAATTMHAWRSEARFAALSRRWAESRIPGDDLVFLALTSWAKQDAHLWRWEVNQRDKALRRRREAYRVWAAQLADRYATLVLEGDARQASGAMDLRSLAELPQPEEPQDGQHDAARSNRVLAATSILRTCLIRAFQARGRAVVFSSAVDSTRRCHVCGKIETRTSALMQTCLGTVENPGPHVWDQDDNAARNLVASGAVASGSGKVLASTKPSGSRWKRRKEEKRRRNGAVVAEGCLKSDPEVRTEIEV